jgi:hypothetical protein
MGEPKDAADKPGGNRPTRTNEKSHAKPDDKTTSQSVLNTSLTKVMATNVRE